MKKCISSEKYWYIDIIWGMISDFFAHKLGLNLRNYKQMCSLCLVFYMSSYRGQFSSSKNNSWLFLIFMCCCEHGDVRKTLSYYDWVLAIAAHLIRYFISSYSKKTVLHWPWSCYVKFKSKFVTGHVLNSRVINWIYDFTKISTLVQFV